MAGCIDVTGPVDVRDPQVITDLPLPDITSAEIKVNADLKNITSSEKNVKITAIVNPKNFKGTEIKIEKGLLLEA
jgi:hypothetical protein